MKAPVIFGRRATLTQNLGSLFIVWERRLADAVRVEVYRFSKKSRAKRPWSGVLIIGACGHVCLTHGRTRAEAVRNIETAVRDFFIRMKKVRLS